MKKTLRHKTTTAELKAFADHNQFEVDQYNDDVFVAHFITDKGCKSQMFVYRIRLTKEGKILLYPGHDSSFAKELNSLEDLVRHLRCDCLIKSSLPLNPSLT